MIRKRKTKKRELIERAKAAPNAYDNAVFEWVAPEYIKHQRGILWHLIMLGAAVVVSVLGFLYGAWTLSLVVIVFVIVYYLVHLEHPQNIKIKISDIGIKVGVRRYSYSKIRAFWLVYEPPFVSTLCIRVNGEMISDITIQLGDQDPAVLREFLLGKIPEFEGKGESVSDALLRLFKI